MTLRHESGSRVQVTAEEQGLPLTQQLHLYDLLVITLCSDSGAVPPRVPRGLQAKGRGRWRAAGREVQDPGTGPVGVSSPEPSSPIMWPQPPQPLSEPSGLMSLQLEPVPEMSTIPPGKGKGGSAWLRLCTELRFRLRRERTETSRKQRDHHPAL